MSASIASTSKAATVRRRPLAAALLIALALPGVAFAQTAKEKELEKWVKRAEAFN